MKAMPNVGYRKEKPERKAGKKSPHTILAIKPVFHRWR
jgi:hypothetical protein